MRTGNGLLLALCFLAPAATAHAGALLIHDDRRLEAFAAATDNGDDYETVGPLSAGSAFGEPFNWVLDTGVVTFVPDGISQAHAVASQTSSFNAAPMFTSLSATANATTSLLWFGETVAISELVVRFQVDTPQDWSIDASIFTTTNAFGAAASVQLRETGAADFIFNLDGPGDLSGAAGGTLQPGEYELAARAVSDVRPVRPSTPTRLARFDFEIIIVPEPATGLLLLGCIGFVTRRSRRRGG